MNDGGVDLAPSGTAGSLQAQAVPLFAFEVYYEHAWNDKFTSTLGYSRTQVVNQSFQSAGAYHSGEYASGNILYLPVRNVLAGLEVLWGQRTNNDFSSGTDVRTQLSFKYSFSSKDFGGKI
jgi:hypothetical protein